MPNHPPEAIIHNFLSNHTAPHPLHPSSPSQVCPICHEDFTITCPPNTHPSISPDDPEYPVRVINCGTCNHIFGRRCIENSIRQKKPYANVCPLCRQEWFPPVHRTRTFLNEQVEVIGNLVGRMEEAQEQVGGLVEELVSANIMDKEVLLRVGQIIRSMRAQLEEFRRFLGDIRRVLLTNRYI